MQFLFWVHMTLELLTVPLIYTYKDMESLLYVLVEIIQAIQNLKRKLSLTL